MFSKLILPILALLLLALTVAYVAETGQAPVGASAEPIVEPARSPFSETVAAAGVVEAQTENISIGTAVPGVVVEVTASVGQAVQAGDPLFRLDDRHLQAELAVRQSALEAARRDLERLSNQPRPEEIPIKEALVREAEANFQRQEFDLARLRRLFDSGSATVEELERAEMAFDAADAQLARALAERDLLRAGSWDYDRAVAAAEVARTEAQVAQIETELDRLIVRSLVDGEVLQVNVRPGEYVAAPSPRPLVLVGNVRQMHVRVDVDEYDIPRLDVQARAVAYLKGATDKPLPLRFVRIEPYVIPKRALTGEPTERVDTRVLQIVYALDGDVGGGGQPGRPAGGAGAAFGPVFVGQQLDVFIDASAAP